MLKDITLGQYFPGNSLIHRLDPRVKLILVIAFVVLIFMAKTLCSFLLLIVGVAVLVLMSGISARVILKSIRPVLFLMLFTAVINLFWTKGEGDPIFTLGFIKIWEQGIKNALFMIFRIVSLVTGTSLLLTYTTSPIELTDALERLLKPLKLVRVPVHDFAMMMTIALRFIPTLLEETDKIVNAQKARGASLDRGNLIDKVKAFVPILIPLFISAFRRADELACAMECRCYRGDEGRTRMKVLHMGALDFAALVVFAVFGAMLFYLNTLTVL
jgi:energy-coupling factor transport system permease protein